MFKKKTCFLVTALFVTTMIVGLTNVNANNPSNMVLKYNLDTQTLNVTITHSVSNPLTHYIIEVLISLNGLQVLNQSYTSQPTSNIFTYNYIIAATQGDTFEVTAICNQVGSITRSITIGQQTERIPGFMGTYLIMGIVLVTLIIFINKKLKRSE